MELLKKLIIGAVGAVASFYATKAVTAALERKPLKTRVREGKQKAVDIKAMAVDKATTMKTAATDKINSLIEEKDQSE